MAMQVESINSLFGTSGFDGGRLLHRHVSAMNVGAVKAPPWQELSDVSAALVGCGHVSGLLMRRGWPLALMLCADLVPIHRAHSMMR